MSVSLLSCDDEKVVVQIEVPVKESMLSCEETLLQSFNEAGVLVTGKLLQRFDTDGTPLVIGGIKYTARSSNPKVYQTPYGSVTVDRFVYQTSRCGTVYCPLEQSARIVGTSTPRFAKMISNKYAVLGASEVVRDLADNHHRQVARSFVKNCADLVGDIVEAKEDVWDYQIPALDAPVSTVSIGLDGTTIRMDEGSFREAMVGTIAFYDREGNRLYTSYCGAAPQYGKQIFMDRFEREIVSIKKIYPHATCPGVADGATDNWPFLTKYTTIQVLDFYHATEYLGDAVDGVFGGTRSYAKGKLWLDKACHDLKHKKGAASRILKQLIDWLPLKMSWERKNKIKKAVTYFTNNKKLMTYYSLVKKYLPIGSGVTEAACKTIIKQRLCKSGMKWKIEGAANVISLRCLVQSKGRWRQLWSKIDQYGCLTT